MRAAALAVTVVVAVSTYLWTRAHSNRAHRERPLNVAPRFLFQLALSLIRKVDRDFFFFQNIISIKKVIIF